MANYDTSDMLKVKGTRHHVKWLEFCEPSDGGTSLVGSQVDSHDAPDSGKHLTRYRTGNGVKPLTVTVPGR